MPRAKKQPKPPAGNGVPPAGALESERLFHGLFLSSRDAILLSTADARILDANPAAEALTGYSRGELTGGMTFLDLTPSEQREASLEAMRRLIAGGGSVYFEKEYVRKDGLRVPVSVTGFCVRGEDGRTRGFAGIIRDLTEERRKAARLRDSEELFKGMFASCPDACGLATTDGRLTMVNEAFARLTGYSREELTGGMRFYDITPPEQLPENRANVARTLSEGAPVAYEKEFIRKDGSRVPIHVTAYAVRDPAGRALRLSAFIRDLTGQRAAERARGRQKDLLELMQAASSAANLASTAAEAIQACIDKVCAFTGWPVGHAFIIPQEGRGLAEPASLWHLAEPERYRPFREATERMAFPIGVGVPGIVWQTGKPIWGAPKQFPRVEVGARCGLKTAFGFPVLVKDQVAAVLEFLSDAHLEPEPTLLDVLAFVGAQLGRAIERERSQRSLAQREELLRLLVSGVRDYALFMLDPRGSIVSWNEGAQRIFGHTSAQAFGQPYAVCFPALQGSEAAAGLRAAVEDGQAEEEGWRARRDGGRFWSNTVVSALRDEAGGLRGYAVVTRDITERKRMEREVLEAGSREQRRIAQDLHDSLGQKLTGISLLVQALEQRLEGRGAPEAAEARKIAGYAADAVRQTRELARGLLPAELAGGLPEALGLLASYAKEALGVECEARCEAAPEKLDELAALHLYRIAQEAINNAVRHGKARRVTVGLASRGGRLTLTVDDDGSGIPAQKLRKPGLGLSIMQYRARMMGASLDIRRGRDAGTQVACSCPAPS